MIKLRPAAADVVYQLDQPFAAVNAKTAPTLVRVGANNDQIVLRGINGYGSRLVLRRVSLVVRKNAPRRRP